VWDNGDLIEPSNGYSSVTVSTKPITKVKAGKTYKYKTVAVNAKGQQGKASGTATAKVKQHK